MNTSEYVAVVPEEEDKVALHKSIRSWALMLIIGGGLSLVASKLFDPGWGLILVVVAILSWKVKNPAMFVIYSVLMGWAALSNILAAITGNPGWLALAVAQVVWTISSVKQYKKYRSLQVTVGDKALRYLGKAGGVLSIVCMVLPPLSFLGLIVYILTLGEAAMVTPSSQIEQLFETYAMHMSTFVSLAVLALALGIAALTAKGNPKGWPIASIVMSSMVLAGWVLLSILGVIGLILEQAGALPTSL